MANLKLNSHVCATGSASAVVVRALRVSTGRASGTLSTQYSVRSTHVPLLLAFLALALSITNTARAQYAPPYRGGIIQDDKDAEREKHEFKNPAGALKTNPELERLMKHADHWAKEGRFDLSATLWQKVLDESRNTLMTRDPWVYTTHMGNSYRIYKTVTDEIEAELAKLPEQGRKVYRLTADGEAKALLASGRAKGEDEAVKAEVVRRLFLSSEGDDAAFELACKALDEHDFVGASRLLTRILNDHPDPTIPRANLLLRLAVANARVGDMKAARAALDQLEADTGIRPSRRVLALVKQDIERSAAMVSQSTQASEDWHMALGSPSRNGHMKSLPSSVTEKDMTNAWLVDFPIPTTATQNVNQIMWGGGLGFGFSGRAVPGGGTTVAAGDRGQLLQRWNDTGWLPTGQVLFDDGRIYFKSANNILCHDTKTGELRWKNRNTGLQMSGVSQMFLMANMAQMLRDRPVSPAETAMFGDHISQGMTISGDLLLNIEGRLPTDKVAKQQPQHHYYQQMPQRNRTNWLAAYGARTGKLKWRRNAGSADAASKYQIGFLAAPVPFANLLLVPVIDGGSIWMYALARQTGDTVWKTFLCDDPAGGCSPYSPIGVAIDGSDAYVASGAGVIFAMDALSGTIRWSVRYPRTGKPNNAFQQYFGHMGGGLLDLDGWERDVIIPHGRLLAIMASDYNHIFALDRRTGKFMWESPRDDARYPLGVVGDRLYVAGPKIVRAYKIKGGSRAAEQKIDTSYGHGALTADAIYLPVKDSIVRLGLDKLDIQQQFGVALAAGDENRDPVGNVFTDGSTIYVAGMDRVYALTNVDFRFHELERRIAAGEIEAYLERMRLRNRLKQLDGAIADLGAACRLLSKNESELEARRAMQDGIFELKLPETRPETALELICLAEGVSAIGEPATGTTDKSLIRQRTSIIQSTLQTVTREKTPGLSELIFRTTSMAGGDRNVLSAARQALTATVTKADLPIVAQALDSDIADTRVVAIAALPKIHDDASEQLKTLMVDDAEPIRLAAAGALANHGDRDVLPVLVDLLESETLNTRIHSAQILRQLTGQQFGFTPYEEKDKRTLVVAKWRDWVKADGATAELKYPITEAAFMIGRTIVCSYANGKVFEFDAENKQISNRTIQGAWSCQGLPNGHKVIASYATNTVFEYDENWKEVWKLTGLPGTPFGATRLQNGNTLVAISSAQKVIEYNPKKEKVWELSITGQPTSVTRLENGNTLVTLQSTHKVVEVDQNKKTVWEISNMKTPFSAQRLPNGNTLICQAGAGKVVEITRDKKEVWSRSGLQTPYDAQRLPNGNTLIADQTGVQEVPPKGKAIWKKTGFPASGVNRY